MPSARDARHRGVDLADHDRRQAERELVAQQHRRVAHQRAADRHHLLLAAGERRCRRGGASRCEDREQRVQALAGSTARRAARCAPISRFSSTQRLGNRRRPSGTSAMPRRTISPGGRPPIGSPSKRTASRGALHQAGQRTSGRCDLPAPLAPMIATSSPCVELEVDAEQRLRVAVEGLRGRGSRAAPSLMPPSPCRRAAPPDRPSPPAARPRPASAPKLMTNSRSAIDSSACTTCSIQIIVTPAP